MQRANGSRRRLRPDLPLPSRDADEGEPCQPDKKGKESAAVAEELFDRILQMTDNAGNTDHDRALNYLAVRYQAIYEKTAEYLAQNYALSAIDVKPSSLSGTRNVLDVIFCYTNRNTAVVEKWAVRVDVTEEFPFLVTKLSPYYDR